MITVRKFLFATCACAILTFPQFAIGAVDDPPACHEEDEALDCWQCVYVPFASFCFFTSTGQVGECGCVSGPDVECTLGGDFCSFEVVRS